MENPSEQKFQSMENVIGYVLSDEGRAKKSFYEAMAVCAIAVIVSLAWIARQSVQQPLQGVDLLLEWAGLFIELIAIWWCYSCNEKFDGKDFFFRCAVFGMFVFRWVLTLTIFYYATMIVLRRSGMDGEFLATARKWFTTVTGWGAALSMVYLFWRMQQRKAHVTQPA